MPQEIEDKANQLISKGCHFDIEMLSTGLISMTCEQGEEVLSIIICPNGPEVIEATRTLVEEAFEAAQ